MVKALFLDRDGTINIDRGYVHCREDFVFINGVFDFCRNAQDKGYLIIIITNQSGIARGYYTEADYNSLTTWMLEEFSKRNVRITDIFHCPDLSGPNRKPEPGMFLSARDKYGIDMANSIAIGDKHRDVEAGERAGVGKNILFTGSFEGIVLP